jgi:predicted ArsR family transcriptional regulator
MPYGIGDPTDESERAPHEAPGGDAAANGPPGPASPLNRLAVLKALGDNTRYAIYLELVRAPAPLSTADIAESLGLHPNTVRPHLERMREVGLLDVRAEARGGVGRPQNRYALAPDAPSFGLEPPAYPVLAEVLVRMAAAVGAGSDDAAEAGRIHGEAAAAALAPLPCVEALVVELARLGFDPTVAADDAGTTIAFANCPFGDLATAHPEVVCHVHRGMVEGLVDGCGGPAIERFSTLVDRQPCRVELSVG